MQITKYEGDNSTKVTKYIDTYFANLVSDAGCVLYYDARQDLITSNGATPDRSGQNNIITWLSFGSPQGLVNESGKISRLFDGIEDYGNIENSPSITIPNGPLAMFATIKVATGAGNGYLFCKNDNTFDTVQQGIFYYGAYKRISVVAEGIDITASADNSINLDTWYNVGAIWDGESVKVYINYVQSGDTYAFSGTLTSRPNASIGRRVSGAYFKGNIATLTVYRGEKAIESNLFKAEKALSKGYV